MLKIENPSKRVIAQFLNLLLFPFFIAVRVFIPEYFSKKLPFRLEKILIIRADHIGDVIMATSIFRNIKKAHQECKISVIVGRWGKEILENNPFVDEIIVHNCPWWEKVRGEKTNYIKWFLKDLPDLLRKIRKEKFDIGIDLRGDFRHILFFLFFGNITFRISYNRSGGEYLLNRKFDYNTDQHEIEKNYTLLEEIGIKNLSFHNKRPEIYLEKRDFEKVEKYFKTIPEEKIKIVIHPSAGNSLRMWKKENFLKIIEWLKEKFNSEIFIVGKEEKLGKEIEKLSMVKVLNMMGKLTIRETAALIKNCNIFLGNDSAIGHIASCFDLPIVILYGPTNPERCKPYNRNFNFIYNKFPCSPCLQRRCVLTGTSNSKCMESIKPEQVISLFEEVIRKDVI